MARAGRKKSTPDDRDESNNADKSAYQRQADKLMTVALELFATRGFSSVTIKDIAKSAKINSALLYYYFTSKEDLFKSSIERAILDALENYARLREKHTNPVDLINDWFENNVQMASPLRKLVKVMLDYSNSQAELASVDALIKRFYKEEMSILSSSIEEGVAMGLFDAVDAARAAEFASVHLDGIMTSSMIRAGLDLDDAVAELKTTFWQKLGYRERKAPAKRAVGRR
jgi:AcrR family transcriptional regulator